MGVTTLCIDGYALKSDKKCEKCTYTDKNASSCDEKDLTKPTACLPGFQFKSDVCTTPCKKGVSKCNDNPDKPDGGLASNCSKGYGKDGSGDCVACGANALTCTDGSTALTCEPGYGLAGKTECKKCTGNNVSDCPAAVETPTKCKDGFFLSSGNCDSACAKSAKVCIDAKNDVTCADGYSFFGKVDLLCQACETNGAKTCPWKKD